jgi:putative ABC transport system permease protein
MYKNYLKIAIRNLFRQKTYSFINLVGLAIGMASCILILLWVQDELSYDRFHQLAERLYRVTDHEKYTTGEEVNFAMNPADLAPTLFADYPEIKKVARLRRVGSTVVQYDEKSFGEENLVCVDPVFLEMFTIPFVKGDANHALSGPSSIIISQKMAQKYFENENPIGKTIRVDNRLDFQVTAVMKEIPSNSHLKIDFLTPFQTLKEFGYQIEGWDNWAFTTYVLLDENIDYHQVAQKIASTCQRYQKKSMATLSLQPVPDIHLRSGTMWGIGGTGDIKYVYIFTIIAGFILLLACINFMNLATARAGNRAKEVGLRKTVGAQKREIISQFFTESMLYSIISLVFAILIAMEFLPLFNSLSGKSLGFGIHNSLKIFIFLVGIAVITGIIAGSYPALFLSSFKPVKVLKGTLKSGSKSSLFRKLLVSFQFLLTIVLIISTIVVNRQLHFIKDQKLGFDEERVLCVKLHGDLNKKAEFIKSELIKNRHVKDASAVSLLPSQIRRSTIINEWEGKNTDDQFLIYLLSADFDFAKTMQIEMVKGRYFSREFLTDTSEGIIINEAAVRAMGMKSPLGKKLFDNRIIGVTKDFHFTSLHSKIGPLAIYFDPREIRYLLVKVNPGNLGTSVQSIENDWHKIVPGLPFEYHFLDDQINDLYHAEQQAGKVINSFSLLALFVACLGLFGLASFTAEQRTKEIGIRKVLGATVTGIVMLLSKEFTRYVLLANIIAWPIAWFVASKWLNSFAYRIDIAWWFFFLAGGLAFLIAILTVITQAVKAAVANPVDSLKYE